MPECELKQECKLPDAEDESALKSNDDQGGQKSTYTDDLIGDPSTNYIGNY